MGIPRQYEGHLKLDLGRVSEPSSTVTGQSLNPALKRGVLKFGHFHCRVAASERRPAFQGRSRQPNLPRRRATDEMGNPNGVRDSSAAGAACSRFWDFGGSDRHSCLSKSSLKQLKTGKNACLYLKCPILTAPLARRGFPTGGTKVQALKGRPTVKRRDAAAKQAFVCPTNIINRENACFMVGT